MKVYKEALKINTLGSMINQVNIMDIPKSDDPELIYNLRSITLLIVVYKMLAKALARRFQFIFKRVVQPETIGFIGHSR